MEEQETRQMEEPETMERIKQKVLAIERMCGCACETFGDDLDNWSAGLLPFAATYKLIDICKSVSITYQEQKGRSTVGLPKVAPLKRLLIPMRETFLPCFKRVCENFADLPDDAYDGLPYWMLKFVGQFSILGLFACTTKRGQEILPSCREFWSVTFANLFCPKEGQAKPKTTREEARNAYATLEELFYALSDEAVILSTNPKAAIPMAEADRSQITNALLEIWEEIRELKEKGKEASNAQANAEEIATKAAEKVLEAQKNKGGRPRRSKRDPHYMTQVRVSKMFGKHCSKWKVSEWERYERTGGARGTKPPSVKIGDVVVTYHKGLRENCTEDNYRTLQKLGAAYELKYSHKECVDPKHEVHYNSEAMLDQMIYNHGAPENL